MESLNGYKTYILVGCALGILVLMHFNIIDNTNGLQLLGALGFGAVATTRAAIGKVSK